MKDDASVKRGSKNLFADLGHADPETHLLKAGLVTRIRVIIKASKFTQAEAAERIGISQPDVSRLLRGQFLDLSVERLIRMLNKLGCDVDIVIRGRGKATASTAACPLKSGRRWWNAFATTRNAVFSCRPMPAVPG